MSIPQPLPELDGLTKAFYDHCQAGELRFQRCSDCGHFRHVPRDVCAHCGSFAWEWASSSGRGIIYTWTVVNRALHPAFADATPYAPVVVELEEGVRVVSQVLDCRPEELRIGLPVKVKFVPVNKQLSLPYFCRA